MIAKVIHIKDAPEGWQQNPNFVYIGRGNSYKGLAQSKWGNPYRLDDAPENCRTDEQKRSWAINAYAAYLRCNEELHIDLPELANKILVCYCHPKHCHGDVLAQWWNHIYCRRHKFHIAHPAYMPRTILIAGSRRPVSPRMVHETKRLVLECFDRNDKLIIGDAPGVDAIAADWAERLMIPYRIYGVTEEGRGIQSINYTQLLKEDLRGLGAGNDFTLRDRYMIRMADAAYFVWNERSEGTKAGFDYARSLKKEAYLITPDKQKTRQEALAFPDL